jgi:hypothetical protein
MDKKNLFNSKIISNSFASFKETNEPRSCSQLVFPRVNHSPSQSINKQSQVHASSNRNLKKHDKHSKSMFDTTKVAEIQLNNLTSVKSGQVFDILTTDAASTEQESHRRSMPSKMTEYD